MALAGLAGAYLGAGRLEIALRIAYVCLQRQGIDPMSPVEVPDWREWFGQMVDVNPLTDQSPWSLRGATDIRYQSVSEVLAALADDDTLKIARHQAHWELFDPWLDAGARYVTEQPNGGRHRFDPNRWPPGAWIIQPPPTPPSNPGKHACRCQDCRHERERTALDVATRALDGPRSCDPDCDACNAPGGPSPDHTARHNEEASQW